MEVFLNRLSRSIVRLSAIAGCCFLVLNIVDITVGIVARQTTGISLVWTEELARFSMVGFVLIGAAAAFDAGDNMSIDFVVNGLPPRWRALCRFVSFLIEATVLVVLIVYGVQNVMGSWTMRTMALGVSRAVPLMAVPVGMGMLLIVLVAGYFGGGRK
ncbi:MAG: TRAP transporter small permease subunit [Fretibacterium sp.]|nr:TRAP transporter small permease subunit [Fretibacterium sp.]